MTISHSEQVGRTGISGWRLFAAIMLLTVGVFNVMDGFVALLNSDYYLVSSNNVLVFNFTAWGWFWIITGAISLSCQLWRLRWENVGTGAWNRASGTSRDCPPCVPCGIPGLVHAHHRFVCVGGVRAHRANQV